MVSSARGSKSKSDSAFKISLSISLSSARPGRMFSANFVSKGSSSKSSSSSGCVTGGALKQKKNLRWKLSE